MGVIPAQGLTSSSTQKDVLGARIETADHRIYRYVKANEAIAAYAIVTPMLALFDGDCDASSGALLNDAAVTFTAATVGAYVTINAGTLGIDDVANKVLSYTANQLVLENAWSADLTTAEDYVVFHPWLVENCDAAAERILGVAPVAIASGEYGWIQTGGFCPAVKVIGGTDAIAANKGLVSSSTAGTAKGLTAAATTADEAEKANMWAFAPTALTQTIPAFLECLP